MTDFSGRVVVVTGASRGIGEFIAYEFAGLGANVVVTAKSTKDTPHRVFEGTIEQTAERVRSLGVEALEVRGDVSHEEDVEAVYRATIDRFGRCDVLVNNAAVSYIGPFLELTVKRWDILMAVNVRGPMLMSRAFLPHMLDRGEGRIINISSLDGRLELNEAETASMDITSSASGERAAFGGEGADLFNSMLAYGTSKAALNRFTVGLAAEMRGRGVAVNALEVGAVTPAFRYTLPDADFSKNELPEAPAQLVTWLADQSVELTGTIFSQSDLLPKLRADGLVRPKVDPH
jgi:NAD(P)-dependent dehydrogenase (short-subunit alcohol dehydrogenase family)